MAAFFIGAMATIMWPAGAQAQPPGGVERSELELHLETFAALPPEAGRRMIEMTHAPDSPESLFVAVQEGQIWRVSLDGQVDASAWLDLRLTNLGSSLVGGFPLRYIAFHPDFSRPGNYGFGKLYLTVELTVSGTPDDDTDLLPEVMPGARRHAWVIVEFSVVDPSGSQSVDLTSGREVLRLHYTTPGGGSHGLTDIAFDPSLTPGHPDYGLLYISSGDNGNGVSIIDGPYAQRLDNLFGKILRIDPEPSTTANYIIPDSNPFATTPEARGEIFAYGLRNPQHLSFESIGGVAYLVASDIGGEIAEEVNFISAGDNYGWDSLEGQAPKNETAIGAVGQLRPPVVQYGHALPSNQISTAALPTDGPTAVQGGMVYRGSAVPSLVGQYVFGDIPRGRFFVSDALEMASAFSSGDPLTPRELLVYTDDTEVRFIDLIGSTRGDARIARGADGEMYVLNKSDRMIRQIVEPPASGACSGGLSGEAEDGVLAGAFAAVADPNASGGLAVGAPEGSGNSGPGSASYVDVCLTVTEAGTYRLNATTLSSGFTSDSFWVGGPPDHTTDPALFHTTISANYRTDPVTDNFEPVTYTLEPGDHTFRFALREDGTLLDRLSLETQ
ncbi:MAG: PQQ-dependent sugar dehydrogenase [Acidimicrobiales bacterium]